MSRSNDPDNFFQTTDSLAERTRKAQKSKNNYGNPIRLPSKILAVLADPTDANRVYVAEAAGTARRVILDTGNKAHVFRGPTTPLTCLALSPPPPSSARPVPSPAAPRTLYAGAWDKTIWSWDTATRAPGRRYVGHSDFVKCVLALRLGDVDLLVSGSADTTLIVWDAANGARLSVLRGHGMAVLAVALDPDPAGDDGDEGDDDDDDDDDTATAILFSGSSDRTIWRWRLQRTRTGPDASAGVRAGPVPGAAPLIAHETSVYALAFGTGPAPDLHTASADGTAAVLARARGWAVDAVFAQGDYVRAVAVAGAGGGTLLTAGRDEDVWVWDGASGACRGRLVGHADEVCGLAVLGAAPGAPAGARVVSVGIDATVRVWPVGVGEVEAAVAARVEAEERAARGEEAEEEVVAAVVVPVEGALSAEEEAELAELMDED